MNIFRNPTRSSLPSGAETADFDLLRARLEVEMARPAVIAITSSTIGDGKEVAARRLASSLAMTGYATLYVDAVVSNVSRAKQYKGQMLEELMRQVVPDPTSLSPVNLSLTDMQLQKTTGQKNVQVAFDLLRSKFDYVVINTEESISTSFATSIVASADAVLVTVKQGRRLKAADGRLSDTLGRIGSRFLGVISLSKSVMADVVPNALATEATPIWRNGQSVHADKEMPRREIAESAS